jgi:hypothetical protein
MTDAPTAPNPLADPATRAYTLVCLAALVVISLVAMERGFTVLTPLPILAGAVGLLARSGTASLMLLFALAGKALAEQRLRLGGTSGGFGAFRGQLNPSAIILCGAVLAYVMAHYRLMGLIRNVFPPDRRRRETPAMPGRFGGPSGEEYQRRSTRLVGPVEWSLFVLALPVWPLLAQLLWLVRPNPVPIPDLPVRLWGLTALIVPLWVLAGSLWVASSLLKYWRRRGMTALEGQILLQDTLWHETRREQRGINRLLAAEGLRGERKEEHV